MQIHIHVVIWTVEIADEFEAVRWTLSIETCKWDVKNEILALSRLLQRFGPPPGRPRVDTLNGSRCANMKEFPLQHGGRGVAACLLL